MVVYVSINHTKKTHHGQIKAVHVSQYPPLHLTGLSGAGGQRMKGTLMGRIVATASIEIFNTSYAEKALNVLKGVLSKRECKIVSISSGLPSGTICEADADASDSPGADSAPAASSDDDDGGDPDPEPARPRSCNIHPPAIAPHPHGTTRRNATATAGDPVPSPPDPVAELWRLPLVLAHIPISRSSWFAGVKAGRYPKPVRLSDRRVAWRASDIRSFVAAL